MNLRIVTAACCLLVLTACGNEPVTVEQASSTDSSAAADTEAGTASTGSLLETGFGQRDEYASVIAMVKNNSAAVGQTVTVQFNLKDAGAAVGHREPPLRAGRRVVDRRRAPPAPEP
ncbi:hypothetical protein [Actinoplanes sp. URMC 104]|uniref:hypothetical protein n=1 Tax=Actinoplanes sp. URMC 104 TaxID=3423409 RepID=UPI003F1B5D9F